MEQLLGSQGMEQHWGYWGDSENLNYAGWVDSGTVDSEQIGAAGHLGSKDEEWEVEGPTLLHY